MATMVCIPSTRVPLLCWIILLWATAKFCVNFGPTSSESAVVLGPISVAITDFCTRIPSCGLYTNTGRLGNPTKNFIHIRPASHSSYATLLVLLLSGEIELHPGPITRRSKIFPCGYCQLLVDWSHPALCCNECDIWFHCSCMEVGSSEYNRLHDSSLSWDCYRCKTRNDSSLFHSYNVDIQNFFLRLGSTANDSVFSPQSRDNNFAPSKHSSPLPNHTPGHRSLNSTPKSLPSWISSSPPSPPANIYLHI